MGAPVWNRLDSKADNLLSSNTYTEGLYCKSVYCTFLSSTRASMALKGFSLLYNFTIQSVGLHNVLSYLNKMELKGRYTFGNYSKQILPEKLTWY